VAGTDKRGSSDAADAHYRRRVVDAELDELSLVAGPRLVVLGRLLAIRRAVGGLVGGPIVGVSSGSAIYVLA
jgi:hypothetical protein